MRAQNQNITVYEPTSNTTVKKLEHLSIQWEHREGDAKMMEYLRIEAWAFDQDRFLGFEPMFPDDNRDKLVHVISSRAPNTGAYSFEVPVFFSTSAAYYIKITDSENVHSLGYGPSDQPVRRGQSPSFFRVMKAPERNLMWLMGPFLSMSGSVLSNMGVNLQKLSMMKESKSAVVSKKRTYFFQPMWLFGLICVIVGSVGDLTALGFAPQSLVAPIGGFTLVCNAGFAKVFLGERMGIRDWTGTGLIIVGIVILAVFGSKAETSFSLEQLIDMYSQPLFLGYCVLTLLALGMFYWWYRRATFIWQTWGRTHKKYAPWKKLHPLACSALSGCLGAQSILCAKSVSELFKRSVEGDNQFSKGITWVIIFAMVFFILNQIHWLARGLEKFDAVFIIPVFQCFDISMCVLGGGVYFREFDDFSALQLIMFFFGLFILLTGVYMLSMRDMSKLKPLQRFRAKSHMLIFIHRTKKAVADKKAVLEKELRVIAAEEAARAAMEMIAANSAAKEREWRDNREASLLSTPKDSQEPSEEGGSIPPQSADNSETEGEKRLNQRMERRSFDKVTEGRKERMSEVEKTKQNLAKRQQSFGGKNAALPIQFVSQGVAQQTDELNKQLTTLASEITRKVKRRGSAVAPDIGGGNDSGSSSRSSSASSSVENSASTTPREGIAAGRRTLEEAAAKLTEGASVAILTVKKGGSGLQSSPPKATEVPK